MNKNNEEQNTQTAHSAKEVERPAANKAGSEQNNQGRDQEEGRMNNGELGAGLTKEDRQ